jgi:hypothetical protein
VFQLEDSLFAFKPRTVGKNFLHLESFLVIFKHKEKELELSVLNQVLAYADNVNLLEGRTEYKLIANDTCVLLQVSKSVC